ncbi:MAG: hypothetical protein ACHQAY_28200, partial [Hyphomicrobiales bacterium]
PPPPPAIAGVTTFASVQASIDQLYHARERLMAQEHGLAAQLLGENGTIGSGAEIGVFALAGSADGGGSGRIAFGNGFSVLGGLSYQQEKLKDVEVKDAVMGALALRYVYGEWGAWRPFAEIGGWTAPDASLAFKRLYANGSGQAVGKFSTRGQLSYAFGRAGVAYAVTPSDEAAISGEIGREWLRTGKAYEMLTPTNPFEASYGTATDAFGVVKVKAQWSHVFTPQIDATIWAAAAKAFDATSGLKATVAGFGTLVPTKLENAAWAEYGLRVGYKVTSNATIDLLADGVSGGSHVGTRVHVGAGLRYSF